MSVQMNAGLAKFAEGVAGATNENFRVTGRGGTIGVDTNDVGVFKRMVKTDAGVRQARENNIIRTQLLDALSNQFGGRAQIPASVLQVLVGSGVRGKLDMASSDGIRVDSGRPLTVRRIRQVLTAVRTELGLTESSTQQKESDQKVGKDAEKSWWGQTDSSTEELSADEKKSRGHIDKFAAKLPKDFSDRICADMKAHPSGQSLSTRWNAAYCRTIMADFAEGLKDKTQDEVKQFLTDFGVKEEEVADLLPARDVFLAGIEENKDFLESLSLLAEEGVKADADANELRKQLGTILLGKLRAIRDVQKNPAPVNTPNLPLPASPGRGTEAKDPSCRPSGVQDAKALDNGTVFGQTGDGNTCSIISTMNALMLTGGEAADKVHNAMLIRKSEDVPGGYYEFPCQNPKDGQNIRVTLDEINTSKLFGEKPSLSPFEKAAVLALRKAELIGEQYRPGDVLELGPAFNLFGLVEPRSFGSRSLKPGHLPKGQLCLHGKEVADALQHGKPCVMFTPGHFRAVQGVTFDNEGLPIFTVVESVGGTPHTVQIGSNGYPSTLVFYVEEEVVPPPEAKPQEKQSEKIVNVENVENVDHKKQDDERVPEEEGTVKEPVQEKKLDQKEEKFQDLDDSDISSIDNNSDIGDIDDDSVIRGMDLDSGISDIDGDSGISDKEFDSVIGNIGKDDDI